MSDSPASVPSELPRTAPASREDLAQHITAWVGRALAEEPPPAGLAAEFLAELTAVDPAGLLADDRRCDLYALWEAMTRVAQEVKLQGRAFQRLQESVETVGALGPRVEASLTALAAAEARCAEDTEASIERAERRAEASWLEPLLDARERMDRAHRDARAQLSPPAAAVPSARGWFSRWRTPAEPGVAPPHPAVTALVQGTALALARLDAALVERGILPVAQAGSDFDPATMRAVEAVAADAAEGTVIEVLRQGYRRDEELVRAADVRVSTGKLTRGRA